MTLHRAEVILRRVVYVSLAAAMVLALLTVCGKAGPTATPLPLPDTPVPPIQSATPSLTATPTPKVAEAPALTPYAEPDLSMDVKTYGGERNDYLYDVLLLADGGTLLAGQANNTGQSHRITPGDACLIRTDVEGDVIWERDYGGEVDALFDSLVQVGEDEYLALGEIAASYERDETEFYLVKIDGEGNELWSHTYGGRGMDHAKMVRQTADGGYVLVGNQADEFPTSNVYRGNLFLIKTDAEGNELWRRLYGDEILYLGWAVAQTPDGGYVLAGWEAKTVDDRNVIVVKTSETGDVEWSRTWDLVSGERDGGFDLILTSDGYIVIACIQAMGSGGPSAVLLKVDLDGNEIWNKLIGEAAVGNTFWDIMEDSDGGYVMAGDTHLGKLPGTGRDIHGGLMIKTDADGEILWQRVFGEGQYDQVSLTSAVVLPDGGYIFVGQVTRSGETFSEMLWLKLTTDVTAVPPTPAAGLPTSTNPPALEVISVDTVEQVELVNTLSGHTDRVMALAFSGHGVYLASYSADDTIKLWEVSSGQETFAFGNQHHDLNSIAFSPDGRLLASGETIWDVVSKEVVFTLDRMEAGHPAFSPDGALLAVGGAGRPVKLWDVATGEVVRTFDSEADNLTFTTEFSPDGKLVATSGRDGIIRLWDVQSGHLVRTLCFGREVGVHDVAFSPDGRLLASGGTDEAVRLWDVVSGETVRTLRNRDGLYGVAFSPDGTLVASAGCDRTVKVWEVASGSLLHTLRHPDEVMAVVFSPDGSLLASGGYDNEVYLWGVPR